MRVLAWVWTVTAVWGLVTSAYMVYEAVRDRRVLKELRLNGLREIVVNGSIRSESLRCVALLAMTVVGVLSLLQVRTGWSVVVGTTSFIVINVCVVANTILDRFQRIRLVNHVDRAGHHSPPE